MDFTDQKNDAVCTVRSLVTRVVFFVGKVNQGDEIEWPLHISTK